VYDDLADLYAIVRATESLEKAYSRDMVTADEYTTSCMKLISQFKTTEAALKSTVDPTSFLKQYTLECPRAYERLFKTGVPATTLHRQANTSGSTDAVRVAETVQHFITLMDAVRLDQRAVDEIHPLLSDLLDSITRIPALPRDFEPSDLIQKWLVTLNSMRAVEEISEEQVRDFLFDLDKAYSGFHRFLKSEGGRNGD
jgi:ESCRT-I complex subunit VPS28